MNNVESRKEDKYFILRIEKAKKRLEDEYRLE